MHTPEQECWPQSLSALKGRNTTAQGNALKFTHIFAIILPGGMDCRNRT